MPNEKILALTYLTVSYAVWAIFTLWIYKKIRKGWVYDLYFMLLYSSPLIYEMIVANYVPLFALTAVLFSLMLFLWNAIERNRWKTILIPLPEIIAVVAEYSSYTI